MSSRIWAFNDIISKYKDKYYLNIIIELAGLGVYSFCLLIVTTHSGYHNRLCTWNIWAVCRKWWLIIMNHLSLIIFVICSVGVVICFQRKTDIERVILSLMQVEKSSFDLGYKRSLNAKCVAWMLLLYLKMADGPLFYSTRKGMVFPLCPEVVRFDKEKSTTKFPRR